MDTLASYINLDRYPIHQLDTPKGQQLIADCQRMMREDTLCLLPDFIQPQALYLLRQEITDLEADAHQVDYRATAYGWMNNQGFSDDHPRSALLTRQCGVITTDQLAPQGHCFSLYGFDQLTEFVRVLLAYPTLYRCACPTLSIQINIMATAQQFGWHFDTNDGVVSISISNADSGGEFEYAPLIRNEDDENYAAVSNILNGIAEPKSPNIAPGTFSLFLGRRSLHRVAPVGNTSINRQSLLFSYDQKPGMVFPAETCRRLIGQGEGDFVGLRA